MKNMGVEATLANTVPTKSISIIGMCVIHADLMCPQPHAEGQTSRGYQPNMEKEGIDIPHQPRVAQPQ